MLIYDGPLTVNYGQFYVATDDDYELGSGRLGQANGLLGAAIPGNLSLTTSTRYGLVALRVELLDGPCPLEEGYEDVVEASFEPHGPSAFVREWEGVTVAEWAPVPGWYRVRYSVAGFAAAAAGPIQDDPDSAPTGVDRYLLQFWLDDGPRADVVLKTSGEDAQYWHDCARKEEAPKRVFPPYVE